MAMVTALEPSCSSPTRHLQSLPGQHDCPMVDGREDPSQGSATAAPKITEVGVWKFAAQGARMGLGRRREYMASIGDAL